MALSSKDCKSLQVFAEHSKVCRDLISLVASAKLQFVGQARSVEMGLCSAKVVSMTHAPLGGNSGEVVAKCGDGCIRVTCVDSRKVVHIIEDGGVGGLVGQLDGSRAVYATNNSAITLYNALNNWSATKVGKADACIIAAAALSSGSHLALSTDHTYIYDLETQTEIPLNNLSSVASSMKTITPHTFAAGFVNGVAGVIDTRSKKMPVTLPCPVPHPVLSVSAMPKGRLAVCQRDALTIWELSGTKPLQSWYCTQKHERLNDEFFMGMMPVDVQGRLVATVGSPVDLERGSLLRIWSPNSHWANWLERASGGEVITPLKTFNIESGKPHLSHHDANSLCSTSNSSLDSIELLNPDDGPLRASAMTVLPDSRLVIAGNTRTASKLSVWV
eukprot:TRINITY_DN23968_c0_g1_i1.p1 TRINITY_DN23968_c0_g1~~TRINITY_DN23968_c0_g1_i1.p1  ORF type:complete len:388 (+),score=23.57 TRINITY_DN23968_c0_g1_i1:64-1227(+)